MYKLVTFEDTVRVPPALFGMKMNQAAQRILREKYERAVDKGRGIILGVFNSKIKGDGKILPGDGSAYFDVQYDALVFNLEVNEVVEGEVSEIVEFGAFVRMGPIDGLMHVSQVANEFLAYDKKQQCLVGRESKKTIRKADALRAKVATVSFKDTIPNSKVALTMRPTGLGKLAKKDVKQVPKKKEKAAEKKEEKSEKEKESK
ncbi:DNA-directed RNA polymerase [Candidatus Micrarchaeota archaeon]|nr:DNA-directed RNA polymerase [Candidatus Micrarchaeota archaeon]